jgi:biofilm PGA synthesis N-glycosyltransferase PgaC
MVMMQDPDLNETDLQGEQTPSNTHQDGERRYVIVTPARNEEVYIGRTIEAVLSQTELPQKWVIVSDGSTDSTDEIVSGYAKHHSVIKLLRAGVAGVAGKKDFGSKVLAFRAGYEEIRTIPHEFVGNLDADITFPPSYFRELLSRFESDPLLGVGGGIVMEPSGSGYVPQVTSLNSVCGSVQLFRRACYDAFGGYIPIRVGGVDAAAEIMARMRGWKVQTFPEIPVRAERRVLTGGATVLHTRYRQGISNYLLGYHPLFQSASSISRVGTSPILFGSLCTMAGYCWACLNQWEKVLTSDAIRFLRTEQIERLGLKLLHRNKSS